MSNSPPENVVLRGSLRTFFHLKKSAAQSHRVLVQAYGDHALSETQCKEWFRRFRSGNFDLRNEERGKKTMLCVWWDQEGVNYYELLKPGETVNTQRYRQQLMTFNDALLEKRPAWVTRHEKVIFRHENAPAHKSKPVRDTIAALHWDVLPHPPYSPDLAPSDYHLFASMGHALAEQHFGSYEEVEKWLDEWFASKTKSFYWQGIHNLSERWQKCVASDGKYFE